MSSLQEVNRLRKTHRPDLPLCGIPHVLKRKRKLTGVDRGVAPGSKKVVVNATSEQDDGTVITKTSCQSFQFPHS